MFESLTDRLESAFRTLRGQGRITDLNVAATVKEIRRALVDADVNYKVAKDFADRVREQAIGRKVLSAVQPGELMVKVVQDELTQLMGGEPVEFNVRGNPAVILLAGLQGSGKTTFAGKLSLFLKDKRGKQPLLVAADVYRPAAIEQLKVLGQQVSVPVFVAEGNNRPVEIATKALSHARSQGHNVVIIDTAGRLAVDDEMMKEIEALKRATEPTEILFVVDAMTGQDAVNTARAFNDRLDFSGVVLTKLDGDTRGGAALSIKYETGKPIKFVSRGEKLDALDIFYPDRMAQRILGMGDIVSLVEKAQEHFDEEEAEKLKRKMRKAQFDFNDFLKQLSQIRKMGNMKDLLSMIPGVGRQVKDLEIDDKQFVKIEAMIQSMTPFERENPDVMDGHRRKRIADGSGNSITEVNRFMKQFNDMRRMMKGVSKMGMARQLFGGR
jgi:signal recognition particle subunit SRP54